MYFGFQKDKKHILKKFHQEVVWSIQSTILLTKQCCFKSVTMDKFHPNLVLVNIKKFKPYQFLDDEAQTIDGPWPIY